MKRTGVLVAALITTACAAPAADTTTTTVARPTTTTSAPTTTTSTPPIDENGWMALGPEGLRTWKGEVVRSEATTGWNTLARDRSGGVAFLADGRLWWLPAGERAPMVVAPVDGDLIEVIATADGPVARIGLCPSVHVRLTDGATIVGPEDSKVDVSCTTGATTWHAVNGLAARITGPGVVLDDEDQIVGIEDVAHLEIDHDGTEVLSVPVGGFYEAYVRIHDFDGRRVLISRGPFEPAMPEESYFLIDLATGETDHLPVMAGTSVTLLTPDVEEPLPVMAPMYIHNGTPILTDDRMAQLEDGRYIGFVTHVAEEGLTGGAEVHFDLAVWFSGKEAEYAALEDGAESPPPNDYYLRNVDPLELVLVVAEPVAVTSVWYHHDSTGELESRPIAFGQFVEAMTGEPVGSRQNMWFDPWWVTIVDGEVVALDEQYVP
jgi:hypothetical protein